MSEERKPEIAYDWKSGMFTKDGQTVTDEEARERWDAIDSLWTVGAYNRMHEKICAELEQHNLEASKEGATHD